MSHLFKKEKNVLSVCITAYNNMNMETEPTSEAIYICIYTPDLTIETNGGLL
jgi:hypothetical protein